MKPQDHVLVVRFRTTKPVSDLTDLITCRLSTLDAVDKYAPFVCTELGEFVDQLSKAADGRIIQALPVRG